MAIDEDATTTERTARERRRLEAEARTFPGCRPVTIRRDEIETWEGRLEYWDADTETAWILLRSKDESGFRARLQGLRSGRG